MSIRNQLFTSFIKGIAKTTGSLTVLSIAAISWHLYNVTCKRYEYKSQNNQTEDQIEDQTQETSKIELECSFINMENENIREQDVIRQNGSDKKLNFKKIFDKM